MHGLGKFLAEEFAEFGEYAAILIDAAVQKYIRAGDLVARVKSVIEKF